MELTSTIVGIIVLLCAVWVIYDVLVNNKRLNPTMKIIWIIGALLFSVITAIVYYFVGRK